MTSVSFHVGNSCFKRFSYFVYSFFVLAEHYRMLMISCLVYSIIELYKFYYDICFDFECEPQYPAAISTNKEFKAVLLRLLGIAIESLDLVTTFWILVY